MPNIAYDDGEHPPSVLSVIGRLVTEFWNFCVQWERLWQTEAKLGKIGKHGQIGQMETQPNWPDFPCWRVDTCMICTRQDWKRIRKLFSSPWPRAVVKAIFPQAFWDDVSPVSRLDKAQDRRPSSFECQANSRSQASSLKACQIQDLSGTLRKTRALKTVKPGGSRCASSPKPQDAFLFHYDWSTIIAQTLLSAPSWFTPRGYQTDGRTATVDKGMLSALPRVFSSSSVAVFVRASSAVMSVDRCVHFNGFRALLLGISSNQVEQ
ncbi:hypothetical protein B0H10DRAFT_2372426 [Mycena sp. CBHHK59/15]|nr:hypothetical protein B0H10DRAFT_2372426 [Mycena sp. CBHHK59/15]